MIQMKSGVYGGKGGKDGMKRASDGPFTLSAEEEARLVTRGVAKYVNVPGVVEELPELPDGVAGIPEYNAGMTAKRLREIGKMCGLTFRVGMTKEEMVAALDAHIEANMVEDPDSILDDADDESEEEETEETEEDAPSFDAAEAVQ